MGWLTAALALRLVANLAVRQLGFVAISDDDYARIVIAQQFAHTPSLDPSQTSWLPFPFWVTGATMVAFGTQLDVAHALAWVTSLACVPAFYLAARWCGLMPHWAGCTTCAFAVFPHAVWLGLATVPEGYAAVLATIAVASCNRPSLGERGLGVTCVAAACLSRYELWPIALVVAIAQLRNPPHQSGAHWPRLLAFLSLLGPLSWLLHGHLNRGDPLFFVKRVANYRSLIGQAPDKWFDIIGNYPLALVTAAPELTALCVLTLALLGVSRGKALACAAAWRPLMLAGLGALAVLVFLVWGDAANGAPTHHPERALQVCWLLLLLVLGNAWQGLAHWQRKMSAAGLVAVGVLSFGLARTKAQQFVDRAPEVAAGRAVAQQLDDAHRLFIETRGYGYLAVAAGSGQPWNVVGSNPNDPRQNMAHWSSPEALRAFLSKHHVRWLIVPDERRETAQRVATVVGIGDVGVVLEMQ